MSFKQPRSVQIILFAETPEGREVLLLRRLSSVGGWWQFVTGSLETGETHRQAAVREVREETGVRATSDELLDLQLTNLFEIAPQWRVKYAPGVTHNEEVCFALRVERCEVLLDAREHEAYEWQPPAAARDKLYWQSSRAALAALQARLGE